MTVTLEQRSCLNCGKPLAGRFCSHCGQRAIPPYPTVREFIGDAWHEFSGYDGRFARTLRALFRRPGWLTREVLEGRRARYISPLRLYLTASVIYFLVAAAAPNLQTRDETTGASRIIYVGLRTPADQAIMTPEDRAEVDQFIAGRPAFVRPAIEFIINEPAAFRARLLETMPKAMFALVPIVAGILAVFYRGRRYSQHLVFALHVHAVAFFALAAAQLPNFTGSIPLAVAVGVPLVLFVPVYVVRALRRVYGSGWTLTLLKAAGIWVAYLLIFVTAVSGAIAWAAIVR